MHSLVVQRVKMSGMLLLEARAALPARLPQVRTGHLALAPVAMELATPQSSVTLLDSFQDLPQQPLLQATAWYVCALLYDLTTFITPLRILTVLAQSLARDSSTVNSDLVTSWISTLWL